MKYIEKDGNYPEGAQFGLWTTLEPIQRPHHRKTVTCRCQCGLIKAVEVRSLLRNKSLGCRSCADKNRIHQSIHGDSRSPTHACYRSMINRCTNPNADNYKYYGGRGISVCGRWRNSCQAFREDMGQRPSMEHSIDRKDPNGNYEPDNCRWLLKCKQGRNKRSVVWITINGETLIQSEWCKRTGLAPDTITNRIRAGISGPDLIKKGKIVGKYSDGILCHCGMCKKCRNRESANKYLYRMKAGLRNGT